MKTLASIMPSFRPLLVLAVIGLTPLTLWAQDNQAPQGVRVRLIDVKADAVPQFEAAIRDLSASLKAQGQPFFHLYERILGDNLPSYTLITPDPMFGETPNAQLPQDVIARIVGAVNGSTLVTVETYPELGIAGVGLAPPTDFLYTRLRVTSPANQQAYFEWQRELAGVLQKAGLKDLRVGRIILGGNTNTFLRWNFLEKFPGDDGLDIAGTIGERDFQRLLQRGASLTVASEDYVLRFRKDLSFTAAQQ